jgi:hypothetical protein
MYEYVSGSINKHMQRVRSIINIGNFAFFFMNSFIVLSARFSYFLSYKDSYHSMRTQDGMLVWPGPSYYDASADVLATAQCPYSTLDDAANTVGGTRGIAPLVVSEDTCRFVLFNWPMRLVDSSGAQFSVGMGLTCLFVLQLGVLVASECGKHSRQHAYSSNSKHTNSINNKHVSPYDDEGSVVDVDNTNSHHVNSSSLPAARKHKPSNYEVEYDAENNLGDSFEKESKPVFTQILFAFIERKMSACMQMLVGQRMTKYVIIIGMQTQQFCVLMSLTNWTANDYCARLIVPVTMNSRRAICYYVLAVNALPCGLFFVAMFALTGVMIAYLMHHCDIQMTASKWLPCGKCNNSCTSCCSLSMCKSNLYYGFCHVLCAVLLIVNLFCLLFAAVYLGYYIVGGLVIGAWVEFGTLQHTSSLFASLCLGVSLFAVADVGSYVVKHRVALLRNAEDPVNENAKEKDIEGKVKISNDNYNNDGNNPIPVNNIGSSGVLWKDNSPDKMSLDVNIRVISSTNVRNNVSSSSSFGSLDELYNDLSLVKPSDNYSNSDKKNGVKRVRIAPVPTEYISAS